MAVELSVDYKNAVSRIRLDPSSYRGGNGRSTRRHVERPKKQAMPIKMSLPKDVEADAEPVSPGNDSQNGEMHSHLWGSVKSKLSKQSKQTVSMHLHSAEEMRVICKDESHLLGNAPDRPPDSIDSLSDSIQKKLELLDQPDDIYQVPSGWSTDHSIGTAQKDAVKSLMADKPEGKDTDYYRSDYISQEADSIETVSEMDSKIYKKIKYLDEPCDLGAPPGWESRSRRESVPSAKTGQPVQESGAGASKRVMPSESYSKNQRHDANTSFSYPVCASDMDVDLKPEDYHDMPLRLRVPNADIFLITSDQDKYCGKHLKDLMEAVEFSLDESETKTMCKVYLWDDMHHKSSIINCITEAQEMCTYVFILLTKNFCNDKFADFQKDDTLVRSVTTETRRWGIVPLYTQPKRDGPKEKAYKIPNGLISFKGLDMSRLMKDKENVESLKSLLDGDVYFRRGLVSMLEARVHERIKREAIRLKERHVWVEQKKITLRREILLEQNRTRLEMERENRSMQQKLASLPKQLPLSPPSPVDFTQEPIFKSSPCQRVKQETAQRSAPCDSNSGPSPPHIPAPAQPMHYPMMLSPEQQQMMMAILRTMQPNMHFPGQPQPPMQPPGQPQFPYCPQFPFINPYQATPQPPQPVDPGGQGIPVNNYYIQAGGNVQVGSQATMVTQEPSATAGYQDDADAMERKYNPDTRVEEALECTVPPDVRTNLHQDWYAEPKKPPDEKPPEEHQHLPLPKVSDMWVKGRRSPVESQSPLLPEKLPALDLMPDSSSSPGKYYSSCSQTSQRRQAQEGSSELTPRVSQVGCYANRHPQPSENTDTHISIPRHEPPDMEYMARLGVQMRPDPPADPSEMQTVPKVVGNPSTPKPISSYDPTGPQTLEDYPKKI